jgi:hypothetical protein
VNQYCNGESCGWVRITTFSLSLNLQPFSLGSEKVTVPIGVLPAQLRQAIERGENANVQLNNVETLHSPGVSWEVYVGLPSGADPSPESPYFVGLLSLFGSGIRDQSHHAFESAKFNFVINDALLAAQNTSSSLTFIPQGILIGGKVVSPWSAPCSVTATTAPVSRSTACSALSAKWSCRGTAVWINENPGASGNETSIGAFIASKCSNSRQNRRPYAGQSSFATT